MIINICMKHLWLMIIWSLESRVSVQSFKSWWSWRNSCMRNFTCPDGGLFTKEAQTLFQYKLGKWKNFGLLQSEEYLPRINVFWTLVKDFVDTWFQVILWSFVHWTCSYFVSVHSRESKTGWIIAIWRVYASDQCFLDFGEGFRGYLISLNFTKFCSQKLLTLCFSTY